jgi:hypothetical protein
VVDLTDIDRAEAESAAGGAGPGSEDGDDDDSGDESGDEKVDLSSRSVRDDLARRLNQTAAAALAAGGPAAGAPAAAGAGASSGDGYGQDYVEVKVTQRGGLLNHSRLVVVYSSKRSFATLNEERRVRHEMALRDVLSLEVPVQDTSNPYAQVFVVFRDPAKAPLHFQFADSHDRQQLCERMCALVPDIDYKDEADTREWPDEHRFNVLIDSRRHVLSLLRSAQLVRLFDPSKRFTDMPLDTIATLESGQDRDERSRLSILLKSTRRVTCSFLDGVSARERFLLQLRTLSGAYDGASLAARPLSLFIGTWNVGSMPHPPETGFFVDTHKGIYDVYGMTNMHARSSPLPSHPVPSHRLSTRRPTRLPITAAAHNFSFLPKQ